MPPLHRLAWYSFLCWFLLFFLWGLTLTLAGPGAVPLVLIVAHLGIVPMLSHQFLRRDRSPEAWKVGIAFGLVGLVLDAGIIDLYLSWQPGLFLTWTTYVYLALRVGLPPITARWLELHRTTPERL